MTPSNRPGSTPQSKKLFWRNWLSNPLKTGAIAPSGIELCRQMASGVACDPAGHVVELGPGTGVVTRALIDRGIPEDRLILIEYSSKFCSLLREQFPKATVIQADAYNLRRIDFPDAPISGIISSLPLVTRPDAQRLDLLANSFELMLPGAPFVQFSYSWFSPVPMRGRPFRCEKSKWIWRNLPPARVWIYRQGANRQD